MSKNRMINTKFWDDSFIINCDPIEKLLFLYCLTNPLTSICGIYEISLKRIAFDTGIDKEMIIKILERFEKAEKIKYENGWIALKNFINQQKCSDNPEDKINIGIQKTLQNVPENLKNWINLNLNSNLNSNLIIKRKHKGLEGAYKEEKKLNYFNFSNVFLLEKEYNTLVEKYGVENTKKCIEKLSFYKQAHGRKYKSDYGAINQWVIDALGINKKQEQKQPEFIDKDYSDI